VDRQKSRVEEAKKVDEGRAKERQAFESKRAQIKRRIEVPSCPNSNHESTTILTLSSLFNLHTLKVNPATMSLHRRDKRRRRRSSGGGRRWSASERPQQRSGNLADLKSMAVTLSPR
jgi:hypothetical protein